MSAICVVGAGGYVGLSYAATLADLGHRVVGVEVDQAKVCLLAQGQATIFEPGLPDLLRTGLASGRLCFTTDFATAVPDAEIVFLCVGTPSDAAGRADLSAVAAAARAVARCARGHTIVVNKSTMPVGSVRVVGEILAEHAASDASFSVVANPEFLREGAALADIRHPARIVLGADDPVAADMVAALYTPLGAPVLVTDPASAEMIKYASNSFLAMKISFVNQIALVCDRLGGDVSVVAKGMGLDERIGPGFLAAGAGFGGSCFPKDVRALTAMARDAGLVPGLLDAVLDTNLAMRRHVVAKLRDGFGELAGKTVALLGVAFKPNTDDVREAPAVGVARLLLAEGARVRASDPQALAHLATACPEVECLAEPYAAAMGADAVVLMTEWEAYRALDFDQLANAMRGRLVLDGRNALPPAAVTAAGLVYVGIGHGATAREAPRLAERATAPAEPATAVAD